MEPKFIELAYRPRAVFAPYHIAFNQGKKRAIIVAHRRCGKTVACIRQLERSALECKYPRGRFGYIAPLYSQAKQIAWEYAKEGAISLKLAGLKVKINESELFIRYPNNAELKLYGADNPDQLRGLYWNGVVLDEIADMRPDLFEVAIQPGLADYNGWVTMIGTPKGRDRFYEYWRKANTEEQELWYTSMLRASETGILSPAVLNKFREDMSEADYNREFECSFDEASSSQVISGVEVATSQMRDGFKDGIKVVGVDVARFGADRTAIVLRHGQVVYEPITWKGLDTMAVVGKVIDVIREFQPDATFVDVGGLGAGVVDRLRQLRFNIVDVNSSSKAEQKDKYHNIRAEMWFKMRDWIRREGQLPKNQTLADDLTSPNYRYDVANRIVLESKDDMKKRGLPSPDVADALALTFAHAVHHPDVRGMRRSQGEDYDPFKPYSSQRGQPSDGKYRPSGSDDYDPFNR